MPPVLPALFAVVYACAERGSSEAFWGLLLLRILSLALGATALHAVLRVLLAQSRSDAILRVLLAAALIAVLAPRRLFFLFYDDFCRNPARVTEQLCGFLGVDYEPAMMRFWESGLHTLTGNMGPYMNVLEGEELERLYSAKSMYLYDRSHLDWHARNKRTISLDERWRSELSADELRAVEGHDEAQAMFATLMDRRGQGLQAV